MLGGLGDFLCGHRYPARIARETHRRQSVRAEADGVVVPTRQNCRTRGGAERSSVEVVVAQSSSGQLVDVRRLGQTAETAEVREAGVIEEDEEDIGLFPGKYVFFGPVKSLTIGMDVD